MVETNYKKAQEFKSEGHRGDIAQDSTEEDFPKRFSLLKLDGLTLVGSRISLPPRSLPEGYY